MSRLEVDQNQSNFVLNGKPFFYLGDTIWSAFTNISLEEWEYYLKRRWEQGFTVLQINTMPQWDRCTSDSSLYPFATKDGRVFDYTKPDERYYENARKMCQMAVDKGFQLALVVLWLNYVPGTWGSAIIADNVMPQEMIRSYVEKVVAEFDEFNPIYVVSGDTDFNTPEAVAYYKTALETVCEKSPKSLKTMHIKRGYDVIPKEFLEKMDFYMFQSGHNRDGQEMAYVLPERFRKKYPRKPMINAEPCYEQMGYSRQAYGRFGRKEVRKAAWHSILSGACAGVTYGAHGVWNWQKTNKPKNPVLGEGFDAPLPWQEALQLPGAWDYGMLSYILKNQNVRELVPANEILENETEEIRVAKTPDQRYLIYLPYSTKVILKGELPDYAARAIDFETGRNAIVGHSVGEGKTVLEMHPFQKDALLILKKEED